LLPFPKAPFIAAVVENTSAQACEPSGQKPWVIAIEGPTAVGKTAVAIAVAKTFGAEILSADARQCYREMRIGVARPSPEELETIPHHFIADRSVQNPLSAGGFEREGLARIAELQRSQRVVVVAGGSGLYVKALLEGLDHFPPVDPAHRQHLQDTLERDGLVALQEMLKQLDPVYAQQVDLQNPHRLLRALSVCLSSGKPYSSFLAGGSARRPRPFQSFRIALSRERADLYRRIDGRVLKMLDQGLLEEVRELVPLRRLSALDTVGYRELFAHLDGAIDLQEATRLIQRNTRRYAKRQMTWLKRQAIDRWVTLAPNAADNTAKPAANPAAKGGAMTGAMAASDGAASSGSTICPDLLDYIAERTGLPRQSFP
jgi:tRNA dimethylallyltransferase